MERVFKSAVFVIKDELFQLGDLTNIISTQYLNNRHESLLQSFENMEAAIAVAKMVINNSIK